MTRYRQSAFASSTKQVYRTQIKRYVQFCQFYGYAQVPASDVTLCRYVAYLAGSLKPQSIRQYLNAVRIFHLESGFENPLSGNWSIHTVIKGVSRVKGDGVNRKLPVTIDILYKVYETLNLSNSQQSTFWAACLVAFFGMMRKSSLFPRNPSVLNHLNLSHCILNSWGMCIYSSYSKTIQCSTRQVFVSLPRHSDSRICPARTVVRSVKSAGCSKPDHFIFSFKDKGSLRPMTYSMFSAMLNQTLSGLGLSLNQYSGHSFRRGGATHAFHRSVPVEAIKAQGDWKSLSYLKYIDCNDHQRADSLKPMFQ